MSVTLREGVWASVTLCDKGEGGQNWPKKHYVIVERPHTKNYEFNLSEISSMVHIVCIIAWLLWPFHPFTYWIARGKAVGLAIVVLHLRASVLAHWGCFPRHFQQSPNS